METLLVLVTVISLALGLGMAVFAWRLLGEERSRSMARVEALQAMAFASEPAETAPAQPEPVRGAMHDLPSWDLPLDAARAESVDPHDHRLGADRPVLAASLFETASTPGAGSGHRLAIAVVAAVVLIGAGGMYALRSVSFDAPAALLSRLGGTSATDKAPPLELTSLRHEIDAGGDFVVTGLVHNPATGGPRRGVVAVVYLFDQEGHYFASGRAALDLPTVQPGDESPFVVKVPNSTGVSKYRVGFRMEDGGVVAHVDRRGEAPEGTTGDTLGAGPVVSPIGAPRRSES